jgi:hypothetical protein
MFLALEGAGLRKKEACYDRDDWIAWQKIELMFDCPFYAMQRVADRPLIRDCPHCDRWQEMSSYEERVRRAREQNKPKKQKKKKRALLT